jgi:hypothetical protein
VKGEASIQEIYPSAFFESPTNEKEGIIKQVLSKVIRTIKKKKINKKR